MAYSEYLNQPVGWNIFDTTGAQLLQEILERRKKVTDKKGVVVFDMDGTLFDVGHRTLGILKEWLASPAAADEPYDLVKKLEQIDFEHIGYSLADAFENAGLQLLSENVARIFEKIERRWQKRFFDGKALVEYDQEVQGAARFAHECQRAGLQIVYLTGRSGLNPDMVEGSRAQLEKYLFPMHDVRLVLKENPALEDHIFKGQVFEKLSKEFYAVANFENEYVNLAEMAAHCSDCLHVILDTQHSGRSVAPLATRVYRIPNFL